MSSPTQSGFRPKFSTLDPLLKLKTEITTSINRGRCAVAAFLDLEKAFDTVWHDGLLHKLFALNIPPKAIKLLKSYLTRRRCRVTVYGKISQPFEPQAGVPQGSVLAPYYFLSWPTMSHNPSLPIPHLPNLQTTPHSGPTVLPAHSAHKEFKPNSPGLKDGSPNGDYLPTPSKHR